MAVECWVLFSYRYPSVIQASFHRNDSGLNSEREQIQFYPLEVSGTKERDWEPPYQSSVGKMDHSLT